MDKRFSGPYEIKYISQAGNCLLEHLNGGTKKNKSSHWPILHQVSRDEYWKLTVTTEI